MDKEGEVRPKRQLMRFTHEVDIQLLHQVKAANPYEDPKRWNSILSILLMQTGDKPLTVKNMRERINLMLEQFEKKDAKEIVTSGVEPPPLSEKDLLLEEVIDLKKSFKIVSKKDEYNKTSAALGSIVGDATAKDHWNSDSGQIIPSQSLQFEVVDGSADVLEEFLIPSTPSTYTHTTFCNATSTYITTFISTTEFTRLFHSS